MLSAAMMDHRVTFEFITFERGYGSLIDCQSYGGRRGRVKIWLPRPLAVVVTTARHRRDSALAWPTGSAPWRARTLGATSLYRGVLRATLGDDVLHM